jgi:hypothetical protein
MRGQKVPTLFGKKGNIRLGSKKIENIFVSFAKSNVCSR